MASDAGGPRVRRGQSLAADARRAVVELHAAVEQADMALVVFFCSTDYDLDVVASEMAARFAGTRVVGCTTAGAIGPLGYADRGISGASFPAARFVAASTRIDHLQGLGLPDAVASARDALQRLEGTGPIGDTANTFGLLLVDGMSVREETVARVLQDVLGTVPLIGGSAGDGERFGATFVYDQGRFHGDAAVLVRMSTDLPFKGFKTQHFVPTDRRVVVTAADARHRVVYEIDGWPAAQAYARLVASDVDTLDPMCFAAHPMVVVIGGANFVRSVQRANPDGSLTFFCAIDEGLVLRVASGVDLVGNLEQTLCQLRADVGEPEVILGFDCVLRKHEVRENHLSAAVQRLMQDSNVVGFHSYGEQYCGVHVNQTFTGIAIGSAADG